MQKNTCEKVHVHVHFSRIFRKLKVISSYNFEIQEQLLPRNNSFFLHKNLKVFETENWTFWTKPSHVFFLMQEKFRMIASNKHLDLRKIVDFVRSKGKTAHFRKPCKSFKIVDEILTCKGKRWVIFDNDRKILNLSILLLIQYSFTTSELQGK